MVSDARKLSIKTYRQEKRDQLAVDVPKGKRDEYKAKAARLGLSLSMLIQHSVEGYGVKLEDGNVVIPAMEKVAPERISAEERRLIEEFGKLPADARKNLLKFITSINGQSTTD